MTFTRKIIQLKNILILLLMMVSANFLYSQSCTITSKANDIIPDGLCAPVSVSWEVTYRGVNDGGTPVEIQFNWDDGNPVEIVSATNTSIPLQEWKATVTHVYPKGGNKCNYNPSSTLMVNGVLCTSSIQEQNVTVWDNDNENGGQVAISPQIFPICVGEDGCVVFQDVSTFNCVPPVENDNPNTPTRWTQWIYGTSYTISGVTVDGSVQAYPFTGSIVELPGPVTGPGAPNNYSLQVCAPNTALVGQFFEVTLRNWNYCNPYDDPSIPGPPADTVNGDFPPETATAIVLIVDKPDATITPAGPFCANHSSVYLSAATSGGTWSGTGITNSSNGRFSPSSAGPGTHTIYYTVSNGYGCVNTDSINIIVYALPTPNILPGTNLEVCPGDDLFLDGNPTPGSGNINSNLWTGNTSPLNNTNIQNPIFNTTSQGSYNLTYTVGDDNGCYNSQNVVVGVNPVIANILPNPAEACSGEDLILQGNPSGGTGYYTTNIWTGDTGPLSDTNTQNTTFNSNVLGTYNLHYHVVDDNGCFGDDDITVTVFQTPNADAGVDDSICGNIYNLNAIPSVGLGDWFQINGPGVANFSNVNSSTSSVTVNNYGLYSFVWRETNGPGCLSEDTVDIFFIESPISDAGIDDSICGMTYGLNASPSVGIGFWQQISGTGNTNFSNINDPLATIVVDAYGSYQYIWVETNYNNCVDTDTVVINFDLVPTPNFTPGDTIGCPPFNVQFNDVSVGGYSYYWDFGNGNISLNQNPFSEFNNSSNVDSIYTVRLIVHSMYGCVDSISHTITVKPSPTSNFTNNAVPSCSPLNVNFTNTSTGAVSYIWNFNDGTPLDTNSNTSHTFVNDTSFIQYFDVQLIAVSNYGCPDTSNKFITVYPNQNYVINALPDSGCSPINVSFSTLPGASHYNWDFGDGNILNTGYTTSNIYVNTSNSDTSFYVRLITTSTFGCVDTSFKTIRVFPSPSSDFTANYIAGCSPLLVNFTNNSQNSDIFYWNYGDGQSDTLSNLSNSHIYSNTLSNTVSFSTHLVSVNSYGCKDSSIQNINVYPNLYANFICDTVGCTPFTSNFTNQSFGANTYNWSFGDGGISSSENPNYTYINNTSSNKFYTVQLIAQSSYGCNDTITNQVTVYPVPLVEFVASPASQTLPNSTVSFNNLTSAGSWSYLWEFGDGSSAVLPTPSPHVYSTYGTYRIKLKAYSDYCEDTISHTININAPNPVSLFTSDNAGCSPLEVYFENKSLYSEEYLWDFGDGSFSSNASPTHTYYDSGNYNVKLISTGPGGQDVSQTKIITVYEVPKAYFKVSPSVVYIPDQPVICHNLSENGMYYIWNFGDGENSFEENPTHYYTKEGEYNIYLQVKSEHNCVDSFLVYRAVVAEASGKIEFPNAFTPNSGGPSSGHYVEGDYTNDIFHPIFEGVIEYNLNIFNRWGELIFESNDLNVGWDGYYRGKICKEDVYVWKVKGKYSNGKSFVKKGDVTLLR